MAADTQNSDETTSRLVFSSATTWDKRAYNRAIGTGFPPQAPLGDL